MAENDALRRLAVTAGALALGAAAAQIPLPGLSSAALAWMPDASALSVLSLGTVPLATSFLFVEAVAFAVPSWRPTVRGGPAERERLWRWGVGIGLLLAAIQGLALATSMEAMQVGSEPLVVAPGIAFRLGAVSTLVAATATIALAARFLDHNGLGSGFAVMVGAETGRSLLSDWLPALQDLPPESNLLDLAGAIVAGGLLLRWGVPPYRIWGVAWLANLATTPVRFARSTHTAMPWAWAWPLLAAGACVGLALAVRPMWRAAATGAPDRAEYEARLAKERATWHRGAVATAILCLALISPALLSGEAAFQPSLLPIIVFVAVVADLVDEHRARAAHDEPLASVWPLHQPYLVQPALAALREAGIPSVVRAARYRALLGPFDPRVAIDVLVPASRASQAEALLARALEVRFPDEGAEPTAGEGSPEVPRPPGQPWSPPGGEG